MKLNKDSNISEVFKSSKDAAAVFKNYGLDCHGCKGAVQDTIEIVASTNGLDLNKFLYDLKNAASK